MNTKLLIQIDSPMFHTTQSEDAQEHADSTGGTVYTWKTSGKQNWLEKGMTRVDAFMFVVLPKEWPDTIDMLDDH